MKSLLPLTLRNSLALASLLATTACHYSERVGDFTYSCQTSATPYDRPHCEHYLTEHYVLRYGEGSGDHVVLAFATKDLSAELIDALGNDIVRRVSLDEQNLVAQTGDGRIFVAPAKPEHSLTVEGPFMQSEFIARYPAILVWQKVQ